MIGSAKIDLVVLNQWTTDPSRPQGYSKGRENSHNFVASLAPLASTWFPLPYFVTVIIIMMNNMHSSTVVTEFTFFVSMYFIN